MDTGLGPGLHAAWTACRWFLAGLVPVAVGSTFFHLTPDNAL